MDLLPPLDVVGYVRVSTNEQADFGVSLRAQRERIGAYASLHRLRVVDVIEDGGVSAKSLDRPGLAKALQMLRGGEASGLLVAKLDRLTRSVRDLGDLLDDFERYHAQLFSVADQIDTRSAMGRMMLNILVTVAQWERETIVERTRDAFADKRANGESLGQVPFGFKVNPDDPRRSKERGTPVALIEDPDELATMTLVHTLRGEGLSLRGIAAKLDSLGIAPKEGGKSWAFSSIRAILSKPRPSLTRTAA